ncbi:MAG: electron transport complex subunit RsxE [Candidatus Omnitrophica bacterium CG_4_9_14_0_2_um_filter_42_8]|nr:MAG: electron transport complex subunit RsxE [Candidatus Omnitrophica bacterium CG_4_9_14_0_2_um_filter_42_8]
MKKLIKEFFKGIGSENPIFRLVLGLCPALAVSTSVINGLGMGIAATFVLLGSNIIISLIRKSIPDQIRIPCFIVIIATFVTIVELMMKAYAPELSRSLGIFVPLIVVNCMVLGRAEAFASKKGVFVSILDALGMGAGFTLGLLLISAIRELLGNGTLFGFLILKGFEPVLYLVLAPGALLVIGLLIGGINFLSAKRRSV